MKCSRCHYQIPSGEYFEGEIYCDIKNPMLSKKDICCAERMRRAAVPLSFLKTSSHEVGARITSINK